MNKRLIMNLAATAALLAGAGQPAIAQSREWRGEVNALLKDNFSYPRSAVVRGVEGVATVGIAISSDGRITNVTLVRSSGSDILDREALRIARKVGRLPSPPKGIRSIEVPIKWALS